VKTESQKI